MSALVRLRELEPADISQLNQWRNDPEVIAHLGNNFFFIAEKVDEEWYANYLKNRDCSIRLAIETTDGAEYIGNVNLTSIHSVNRSAEFSIMIGNRSCWGGGMGTEATRMMLDHAFNDKQLHRVWLTVLTGNERAIRMYRKLGFVEEGVERESIFKNGAYEDVMLMSVLAREFS